jgi:hypothetical protein
MNWLADYSRVGALAHFGGMGMANPSTHHYALPFASAHPMTGL